MRGLARIDGAATVSTCGRQANRNSNLLALRALAEPECGPAPQNLSVPVAGPHCVCASQCIPDRQHVTRDRLPVTEQVMVAGYQPVGSCCPRSRDHDCVVRVRREVHLRQCSIGNDERPGGVRLREALDCESATRDGSLELVVPQGPSQLAQQGP